METINKVSSVNDCNNVDQDNINHCDNDNIENHNFDKKFSLFDNYEIDVEKLTKLEAEIYLQKFSVILEYKNLSLGTLQENLSSLIADVSLLQQKYNIAFKKCVEASKVLNKLKDLPLDQNISELSVDASHTFQLLRVQRNQLFDEYRQKSKEKDELQHEIELINSDCKKISKLIEQIKNIEFKENNDSCKQNNQVGLSDVVKNNDFEHNSTVGTGADSCDVVRNNTFWHQVSVGAYSCIINLKLLINNIKGIRGKLIVCFLFLPSFFVLLYCLFFYDSMYLCKSTFTIQSNENDKITNLSSISLFNSNINKDLYIAAAYIQSLDLFNELDKEFNLIEHYSNHDFVSSLKISPTQSEIEDYWHSIISIKLDSESNVINLSLRAYDPEFAKIVVESVLKKLEILINSINSKALDDSLKLAQDEVTAANIQTNINAEKLRNFRNSHSFIDPKIEISNLLSVINSLEGQLTQTRAELSQKRTYLRENSVEIIALKNKSSSLENEIKKIRLRLAQPYDQDNKKSESSINGQSENKIVDNDVVSTQQISEILSESLNDYEKLILEYEFSQKLLNSALSSLEETRQVSLSKMKYLVTIDKPKVPNESLWPKPFIASFVTLIFTFLGLSGISLLISAIKEHLGI